MKLPMPFGNPSTYKGHGGIDFAQRRGTVFRASGPGRVYHKNQTSRGGYQIWVAYDNGPRVGYAHMDSFAGSLPVDSGVIEGTILGAVGSLGQNSTGPHLHIEIDGEAYSDAVWKYFDRNRVVSTSAASTRKPKKERFKMHEALIRYGVTNQLLIVNMKDKTIINLGNAEKSGVRAYYANNFPWSTVNEPEWTNRFANYTYI